MRLMMTVKDGQGLASQWSEARIEQYSIGLSTRIVPGTLNLETPLQLESGRTVPVEFLGKDACKAWALPVTTPGTIEVIADCHLRTALGLKTGDHVQVKFDADGPMASLCNRIQALTEHALTLLDVGAGRGKFHPLIKENTAICSIDGYAPDLQHARKLPHDFHIHERIEKALPDLWGGNWCVALAIDVIEHLEEDAAKEAISQMKRLAHRVGIFCPLGIHPQAASPDNELQEHRSTWYPSDLEALGFTVFVYPEFHKVQHANPAAMWAEWKNKNFPMYDEGGNCHDDCNIGCPECWGDGYEEE